MKKLLAILIALACAAPAEAYLFEQCQSYYKFNESTGTAKDSGPLRLVGTPTGSVAYASGHVGNCASFTAGSGNYIQVADHIKQRLWNKSTIAFGVYVNSYSSSGCIISKMGDLGAGVRIESGTGGHFYVTEGGSNLVDLKTWVTAGSWHRVVITLDNTASHPVMRCYVDGTQRGGDLATTYFWLGEDVPLRIGAPTSSFFGSGTAAADFKIDELGLFRKQFSSQEVADDYDAGGWWTLGTSGLVVHEFDDQIIYQREPGTNEKTVQLTAEYSSGQPDDAEYRLFDYGTEHPISSWKSVRNAMADDGDLSGFITLPTGGDYSMLVRTKAAGSVLETSITTVRRFAVGEVVVVMGQSNGEHFGVSYGGEQEADVSCRMFDGVDWVPTTGNGQTAFANSLREHLSVPIGIINVAIPGTGVVYDAGAGEWMSTEDGEPWALARDEIVAAGGDFSFVLHVGTEADSEGGLTQSQLAGGFDTLYERSRELTGRSSDQLTFGVTGLATIAAAAPTDAGATNMREWACQWCYATPGALYLGSRIDCPRTDDYHYAGATHEMLALRYSDAFAYSRGIVSSYATGARIVKAWAIDGTRDIYLVVANAPSLTATTGGSTGVGLTGISVGTDNTFGTARTISSTAYVGNSIRVRCATDVVSGDFIRAGYGKTPTVTNWPRSAYTPEGGDTALPITPLAAIAVDVINEPADGDIAVTATLPLRATGTVGYRVTDAAGVEVVERTTSGVIPQQSDDAAGTMDYSVCFTPPEDFESGFVVIDNGQESRSVAVSVSSAGGGGGTPPAVLQRIVSPNRVLQVKDRGDGTYGVVGDGMNVIAGEPKQLWALEFKGTQLPAGQNLFSMSEPEVVGDDAADATIGTDAGTTYGVQLTKAAYEFRVDSDAEAGADMQAKITVQFTSSGDGIDVYVPVNVKAAEE